MLVVQPQALNLFPNVTKGKFFVKPRNRYSTSSNCWLGKEIQWTPLFGIEETDKFGVLTNDCNEGEKQIEEELKSTNIRPILFCYGCFYKSIIDVFPYPIFRKGYML